jgi:hypothetical protein
MIGALAFAFLQAAAVPGAPPVVTWSVKPESVTVAEPFTVTVEVRAPREVAVAFPAGPDSSQMVEAVDPPVVAAEDQGAGMTVRRATYRLMAWETGPLAIPIAPVTVGAGAAAQTVPLRPSIFVRSVLPADSALRVPRPALDILAADSRVWLWWTLGSLVLGLLAFLFYRYRKRRKPAPPPSALAAAQESLQRIDALGLLEAGEPSRYVRLCVDVLRDYLSARVAKASRAHTTGELVGALRGRALPVERVAALLADADQVQFARRSVSAARAKEMAAEVRAVLAASDEAFARDVPVPEKVA